MTYTRKNVVTAVESRFPQGNRETIFAILDEYGTEPHHREKERVQLAIVELSEGIEERLIYFVQIAKNDSRDILAWRHLGPISENEGAKLRNEARELLEKLNKK